MKIGSQDILKDTNILMIHEIKKEFFNLNLQNYVLTFDDGLYSQFYYSNKLNKIPTRKILFITPSLIQNSNIIRSQFSNTNIEFPACFEAMEKWVKYKDNSDYMTIAELKKIIREYDFEIGAHSYNHNRYPKKLSEYIKIFKKDTEIMIEWFIKNLNFKPTSYCFPFNVELVLMRSLLINEFKFNEFFGNDRIDIQGLI